MPGKIDSVSPPQKAKGSSKSASVEDEIFRNILDSNKKKKRKSRTSLTNSEILISGAILLIAVLFVVGAIYYYNLLLHLQYDVEANLAQIDTQLQKRKNLIINLGTTIVEYSQHEKQIFNHVAELRTLLSGNNTESLQEDLLKQLGENGINSSALTADMAKWEGALSRLMAIAEQYPDLKLSENFRTFMEAILGFETNIAELRMVYNTSVNDYSTKKDQVPGFVYAYIFRFRDFDYFMVDDDARRFIPIGTE